MNSPKQLIDRAINKLGYSRLDNRARRDASTYNTTLDKNDIPPHIWGILGFYNSRVLGKEGIYPDNVEKFLRKGWLRRRPDGVNRMYDWQFQVLAELVFNYECFIVRDGSAYIVYPKVAKIIYDQETMLPIEYQWNLVREYNTETVKKPASEVTHLTVNLLAGQRRPFSPKKDLDKILTNRQKFINHVINHARNASVFSMLLRQNNATAGTATADKNVQEQMLDIDDGNTSTLTVKGGDKMEVQNVSRLPAAPQDVEKMVSTSIARRYALSRLQASGDYDAVNYSSGRLASINDDATLSAFSRKLEEAVELLWFDNNNPFKPIVGDMFEPEWHRPILPSIDPVKTAAANERLYKNRLKSAQQIIREDDRDPDETMAEILEWERQLQEAIPTQETPTPNEGTE